MPLLSRSPHLQELFAQGKLLSFRKDELVTSTDSKHQVMMMVEGYVKRYMITRSGSLGIQIVYGPQDVFSLTNVFELLLQQNIYDGPSIYYYQTMSAARLYLLDADVFCEAVQRDPVFYKELFSEAGQHLMTCVYNIENNSLINSYEQVAHGLLYYAKKFGIETEEGTKIGVPLTHQDIADILGITRQTATRAIIKLRNKGMISTDDGITVPDIERLERAAYH